VQIVFISFSQCHCHPHHLLPHLNPDWFYLSGTGLPRLSWKRGRKTGVVIVEDSRYDSAIVEQKQFCYQDLTKDLEATTSITGFESFEIKTTPGLHGETKIFVNWFRVLSRSDNLVSRSEV